MFVDFPFKHGEEDLAVVLALILTLAGRSAIQGPVPMSLFSASTPSAGKGKLATIASLIVYGVEPANVAKSHSDEEERKSLESYAFEGRRFCVFDNVTGRLGSDALNMFLTSDRIEGRRLGGHAIASGVPPVLAATGQNLSVRGDLARRVLMAQIETNCERPELRSGFRHPHLDQHVREIRPQLVSAALTILRWHFAAGCPQANVTPLGSYEAWSLVVRSALVYLGLPDPVKTQDRVRDGGDPQVESDALALELWQVQFGTLWVSASQVIDVAEGRPDRDPLRVSLAGLHGSLKPHALDARFLGYGLSRVRGRLFRGSDEKLRRLERGKNTNRGRLWRVVTIGEDQGVTEEEANDERAA